MYIMKKTTKIHIYYTVYDLSTFKYFNITHLLITLIIEYLGNQ